MRALVDEGVDDGSAAADSADAPRRSAVLAALGGDAPPGRPAPPPGTAAARRSGPTPLRLAGIALVSGLLLLTHYWSFYLLGTVGLLLVLHWWRAPATPPATPRGILAIPAGGLLFLPWLGGFLY